MDIAFRTKKLARTFNSERVLDKTYGTRNVRTLAMRLAVLRSAEALSLIPATPPERRHQLRGNMRGLYAVDLVHPYRLIFRPNHDPVPLLPDGGVDIAKVTAIRIIGVIDYH